jgi:phosphatidyl-myo-inositol dimannoside synthase
MVARLESRDPDRVSESPAASMNTVLLLPALFSSDGGIERILRLYVRAAGELTGNNGRVDSVILNDSTVPSSRLAPYTTTALASPHACRRSKLACVWHTIRLARRSERLICGHVHLLRLAHLARRFSSRLEIWLIAHGIEVWRPFTATEQQALRATERILCVSDFTRRQLALNCPNLDSSQLIVQPNALDPQFEVGPISSRSSEAGLILSISRLDAAEAYKGIDHLIEALPAIRATVPTARLRVVGNGNDRTRLEQLAAARKLNGAVEFTGRVSDSALRQHLASCDIFALPSRGEGFGLVYLEAMANGKPCVAADAGGAPEVVDSSIGALVPYADVQALAQACINVLQADWDPAKLRARAGEFSYDVFRRRLAAIW